MNINTKEIEVKNTSMLEKANALIVNDDEGLIVAGKFLTGIKTHVKNIKATFKDSKAAAKLAHSEVCDLEKKALGASGEAELIIKGTTSDYATKQEKLEKARAAKLAAELKAKAEADALELAMNLETNGQNAEAAMALEVAAAPVVVPQRQAVKVAGVSFREAWEHKVIDPDKVPDEFWIIDEQKLAKFAKAMKDQAKVEGVVFSSKKIVAARA